MGINRPRLGPSRGHRVLCKYALTVGARGLFALCIACTLSSSLGCRSTAKTTSADPALTPQEQTHRDQLAAMGREDAAESEPGKRARPTTIRDRRSGQRTIDQPRR